MWIFKIMQMFSVHAIVTHSLFCSNNSSFDEKHVIFLSKWENNLCLWSAY